MNTKLVDIHPRELKFIFEVKKQCSCSVHLANVTDQYVAFKVKTTSPRKYCVRPNVGIIKPKSSCDFIVIMQALKSAPLDMQCKDKFLVQSTVVAFGTTEEEITPGMFAKDNQKHIEETKLRVILTIASDSPSQTPVDAVLKQEISCETSSLKEPYIPVLLPVNGAIKQEPSYVVSMPTDKLQHGAENFPPDMLIKRMELITNNVKNVVEPTSFKVTDDTESVPAKNEPFYHEMNEELEQVKDVEEAKLKLLQDIKELRSKITDMDTELSEARDKINKLREEKSNILGEKETLKQELVTLRRRIGVRKVQVGFPPLFVCMVAMISLTLGFFVPSLVQEFA